MSSIELRITGLDELRAALRNLPPALVHEGATIVQAHATEMARQVQAAYPTGPTGNLKQHVVIETGADATSATARVRSTARHAWLYERGSAPRHWKGGKSTGRMPAADVFIPIAIRRRQVMTSALIELVERAGLVVTRR